MKYEWIQVLLALWLSVAIQSLTSIQGTRLTATLWWKVEVQWPHSRMDFCVCYEEEKWKKKNIIWPVSEVEWCSIFFSSAIAWFNIASSSKLCRTSNISNAMTESTWTTVSIFIRAMCHWGKQSSSQCSESPPGLLIKSTCLLIAGRKQHFAFSLSSILDSLHSRYFDFSAGNRWLAYSS